MKDELKGELTIFLSCFFFAVSALLVKVVSANFTGVFISFVRFVIGIILGVLVLRMSKWSFKVYDKRLLIRRGIYGAIAMVLYFTSIQVTSSGRATLLNYTYPINVAIFGYLFFREKISRNQIYSILICLVGVVFVFYDGSSYSMYGTALGLLSGLFAGMAVHYIKQSRESNNPAIVYMAACLFGLIPTVFSVGQVANLTVNSLLLLVAVGVTIFVAQIFMGYGYRHVSPTKGSIISFAAIPLTIFFSYFIGEEMRIRFFVGALLVIVGLVVNRAK